MSRKHRTRPVGIRMLCLWAVGLIIEVGARTLLPTIKQTTDETWKVSLLLPTVIVAMVYILALGAAIVGLLWERNWGRKLFLALVTTYYGLLLVGSIGLWGPLIGIPLNTPGQGWVTTVVLEASLGLGFGWWYLNRQQVKSWFGAESQPEQVTHDDKKTR